MTTAQTIPVCYSMFQLIFAINYSVQHSFVSIPYVSIRPLQRWQGSLQHSIISFAIFIVFVRNEELLSIQCGLYLAAQCVQFMQVGIPQSVSFHGSILRSGLFGCRRKAPAKIWDGDCAANGTAWTSACQQIGCKCQIKPTSKTIPVNSYQGGGEKGKERLRNLLTAKVRQKFRIYLQ